MIVDDDKSIKDGAVITVPGHKEKHNTIINVPGGAKVCFNIVHYSDWQKIRQNCGLNMMSWRRRVESCRRIKTQQCASRAFARARRSNSPEHTPTIWIFPPKPVSRPFPRPSGVPHQGVQAGDRRCRQQGLTSPPGESEGVGEWYTVEAIAGVLAQSLTCDVRHRSNPYCWFMPLLALLPAKIITIRSADFNM